MELKSFFREQLDREAAASRKVLERVPEGKNDWKPHARSMDLGYLAAPVATMPGWLYLMIDRDELDLDDSSRRSFHTRAVRTRTELLRMLDEAWAKSSGALLHTTEDHLMRPWRLLRSGQVLAEGARYAMISDGALSHMAHHRGQLTVYLRLNDQKVPAIYGPSADELG